MKKKWFWILGGGVVVAAAVIIILVLLPREEGEDPMRSRDLGMPVFPGSTYIGWADGREEEIDGRVVTLLPDAPGKVFAPLSKVLAFFHRELADWNYQEIDGVHYFWEKGPDDGYTPNGPLARTRQAVRIEKPEEFPDRVWIAYSYQPKK